MGIRRSFIFVLSLFAVIAFGQGGQKTSSVLKSGTWFRIKVPSGGVYKLSYAKLNEIGINAPENIRLYGLSGKQLPNNNGLEYESDLEEIPLYQSSDNYYLFYGVGNTTVDLESDSVLRQHVNDYALWNYYFISASFGPGERIEIANNSLLTPNYTTSDYDYVDYFEEENEAILSSGRLWFSGEINNGEYNERFTISNINTAESVYVEVGVAVQFENLSSITLNINDENIDTKESSGSADARYKLFKNNIQLNGSTLDLKLKYNGAGANDRIYLDYVTINARSKLVFSGSSLAFQDVKSAGAGKVAEFKLSSAGNSVQIWNVTDPTKTYRLNSKLSASTLSFVESAEQMQKYIAVNTSSSFPEPIFTDDDFNDVGWIDNQNIHGTASPEFLVVTHPAFLKQANQLAELHRLKDNMTVEVYTTEQVYNEFSSGRPEAGAIRNLARLFYERSNEQDSLKYLMLFGDGSFDNRTIHENNPNYIPTFQSEESLSPNNTYVTDDFYAFLEPSDDDLFGEICIGVGRLPVSSDGADETEAQGVVNKIIQYYNQDSMSDWKNNLIFAADDGEDGWDKDIFMRHTDEITNMVEGAHPIFNKNKIYLDAYQQISSSTGASYPDVELALDDAFKKGALIFNYMGHGGEEGITQEHVFTKGDMESMQNAPYFPLFVTATCQLSRYDDVQIEGNQYSPRISAGEVALLNPDGGAIALLTTTRVVYQSSNRILNNSIYSTAFERDYKGNRLRFGDILRIAKNKSTAASPLNTMKFTLLGDPAITLPYGEYLVLTDSINGKAISEELDTLNALSEVTVSGFVANADSLQLESFNGKVYVSVFDKAYVITTNGNDDIPTLDFKMQDKLLYRGIATVTNGKFRATFKVPKDISYNVGSGKITYYAENGIVDAKGVYEGFEIGQTSEDAEVDIEGPQISLFMNDMNFQDGGITDSNPELLAYLYDSNGINTTGNGIGHDLTAVLDDDLSQSFLLNDYFVGQIDDYRRGVVRYPLTDLEDGSHTIALKVWDTYNNSSEETIGFYVDRSGNLVMNELLSYPNPARDETFIQYSHNSSGQEHDVTIEVYDATGRRVFTYRRSMVENGYVSEPIRIDFTNINGAAFDPGVYPYKVSVETSEGSQGNQSSQLIIIP